MTRFTDGPAGGRTLLLRRSPLFLRVTRDDRGKFDALDQLHDEAEPGEAISAYRKVSDDGTVHVDSTERGRRVGRWYRCATYAVVAAQPDDATMRDTEAWRGWCQAQAGKDDATK